MDIQYYKKRVKEIASHPSMKEAMKSLKPSTSYWGLIGIIFFFFVPEIVAYFYGNEIVNYANSQIKTGMPTMEEYSYKALASMGEVSVVNLLFGVVFVVVFFVLRKKELNK